MEHDDPSELHDLERLLGDAFDAHARAAVPDHATPPPPRFADDDTTVVPLAPRRRRWAASVAVAAAVAAVAVGVSVAVANHGNETPTASSRTITKAEKNAQPVHVSLLNSDGQTYGVGMPVIAYFSRTITDARAFQAATTVTVDGKKTDAAWYFEPSKAGHGPLEAHLRPPSYWPADSRIHVAIRSKGATAGRGLGFDDSLSLDFRTGPANFIIVYGDTHRLTLSSDGVQKVNTSIGLGSAATPTMTGTKIVMDKLKTVASEVPTSQKVAPVYALRVTYGGEFIQAAPAGDSTKIGHSDTGGSVLMDAKHALALYRLVNIGDVVIYRSTGGPAMTLGAGYGDQQVSWTDWLTGGAVPTH